MSLDNENDQTGVDYIHGAEAIGTAAGLTARQVYHLTEKGELPVGKLNGKLFTTRQRLHQYLDSLITSGGVAHVH